MNRGPPNGTFRATDFMCVIIAEPVTDLAITGVSGWAKRSIAIGLFSPGAKASAVIGANDPDGLHDPLTQMVIEAPHEVPDGVPEHANESR